MSQDCEGCMKLRKWRRLGERKRERGYIGEFRVVLSVNAS